jgi:two-component system, sensor histidine kinase RegB
MTDHRPSAGFDSALFVAAQDGWAGADIRQGHLRVRTLLAVRWMVIVGEILILAAIGIGLGHQAPFGVAGGVVLVAIVVNLLTARLRRRHNVLTDREALLQLCFDVAQIAALMGLIGGTANPFVILIMAPVTLAAATLPPRPLAMVAALAGAAVAVLAVFSLPYPSLHLEGPGPILPDDHLDSMLTLEYRMTVAVAAVAGIALIAGIVRQSVAQAARMALALDVTRTVLAREQRLSSLGLLAAATAHELGTPLSTISVIARELSRAPTNAAVSEDAALLIAEAARCREILGRLREMPERATESELAWVSLRQLLQEVVDLHRNDLPHVRVDLEIEGDPEAGATRMKRSPEVGHAMSTLVENAVDFARTQVRLIARLTTETLTLEVHDDGPGFAPDILPRIGEPYVTSRPNGQRSPTGHVGLGLGVFIATTLLERTGAAVTYRNDRSGGAIVSAQWKRSGAIPV